MNKEKDKASFDEAGSSTTSSALDQSQQAEDEPLSQYELKRNERIAKNKTILKEIGIPPETQKSDPRKPIAFVAKAHTADRACGEGNTKQPACDRTSSVPPSLNSPTRENAKRQRQNMLVVMGTELGSSNPWHPERNNVHFPLKSLGCLSVMWWRGTIVSNVRVCCLVCCTHHRTWCQDPTEYWSMETPLRTPQSSSVKLFDGPEMNT